MKYWFEVLDRDITVGQMLAVEKAAAQNFEMVSVPDGLTVGEFGNLISAYKSAIGRQDGPETLTDERKSTHGDWKDQAQTALVLKGVARERLVVAHKVLPAYQQEAIDMILVKISRIINGNENEPDHWDDIAGYAYLGKGGRRQKSS